MNLNIFTKESGIYCIENVINNKKYIGKSNNVRNRIRDHICQLTKNKNDCTYLQNAWNKNGEDNFIFYIVEECQKDVLNEREIFFINYFQSNNKEYGYNLTKGGDGTSGYKFSEEQLSKKSGKNHPLFGKNQSIETRQKMKDNHADFSGENHPMWGKHHREESKNKIRDSRIGKYSGENSPLYGVKKSEEHKKNISISKTGEKSPTASSKYHGVRKVTRGKQIFWRTQLRVNGVMTHIGCYEDENDAAVAYNIFVIENNLPNPLNSFDYYLVI